MTSASRLGPCVLIATSLLCYGAEGASSPAIGIDLRESSDLEIALVADDRSVIVEFAPHSAEPGSKVLLREREEVLRRFRADLARTPRAQSDAARPAIRYEFTRAFFGAALQADAAMAARIRKLPYVRAVHPDRPVRARSEPAPSSARSTRIGTMSGNKGAGVRVAVIDSGIDYLHPALGGGIGAAFKVIGGWDFVNDDPDPMDDFGHGTHVAGIIAGSSSRITGVAPEASLLAIKVLDQNGGGSESMILAAIELSLDPNQDGDTSDHVEVINMSIGGTGDGLDPVSRAVDAAYELGVVVVASAGNEGTFQSVGSPGSAVSAITVGAVNSQDRYALFSSKGPTLGAFLIKPEIMAPGTGIESTSPGGGYSRQSGTSMAAPHVAGLVAILRSLNPDWTPAMIRSAVISTARPIDVPVNAAGAGRVDEERALRTDTFITPQMLNFGRAPAGQPSWSSSRSIEITNRSSNARTWTVSGIVQHPGIDLDISSGTVNVSPGETESIDVEVVVDSDLVEQPPDGSFMFAGSVELRSGEDTLTIPWSIVRGTLVRLRYEGEGLSFPLILSERTASSMMAVAPNVHGLLVENDTYDFVASVSSLSDDSTPAVAVLENQLVNGDAELVIRQQDVRWRVKFEAFDESGIRVQPRGDGPGPHCVGLQKILVPDNPRITAIVFSFNSASALDLSTFSNRYTIVGGDGCLAEDARTFYGFSYPLLFGVDRDVVLQSGGNALRHQDVELIFPDPDDSHKLGFEIVPHRSGDAEGTSALIEIDWPARKWNGNVSFSDPQDERYGIYPRFTMVSMDGMGNSVTVQTPPLRVDEGRVVAFEGRTPSPVVWRGSSGTMRFGLGPVTHSIRWENVDDTLRPVVSRIGGIGETRWAGETPLIIRADGTSFHSIGRADLNEDLRLEQYSQRTHRVVSRVGELTTTATFGGGRSDPLPPTFTSFRLLNGTGTPAEVLSPGTAARLVISAIDLRFDEGGKIARGELSEDSVHVWFRKSGSLDWNPLQPVVIDSDYGDAAELGHEPVGTVFSVDLFPITSSGEKVFDLKLSVEDAAGNVTETVIAPAVQIDTFRRRLVRR